MEHDKKEKGIKDFLLLRELSEEQVVANLRIRFLDATIYTLIGEVVVSVNPYTLIPNLYGPQQIKFYRNRFIFDSTVNPHVYALADAAYSAMKFKGTDQVVIISGESGSGKTEASKVIMQFIAGVNDAAVSSKVERVKEQLLRTNPVLEAFGNAMTTRNDNSSRFGKYMDIQFNFENSPAGGDVTTYLLEKSRVVHQEPGERNFHIFYQMLHSPIAAELGLRGDGSDYVYLGQGGRAVLSLINDTHGFKETKAALDFIGFTREEQSNLFRVLASIVLTGEVTFKKGYDGAHIPDANQLTPFWNLLGVSSQAAQTALTTKSITSPSGEILTSPLTVAQAEFGRNSLAKQTYQRLFWWLVRRINDNINGDPATVRCVLGVLDIYGFEIFESNSFEQFCINYCNEKLQQLFIELVLRKEQEEYKQEGIQWQEVSFFNNRIICDLIDANPGGIIALLDEQCLMPGDRPERQWLDALNQVHSNHPHYDSKFASSRNPSRSQSKGMGPNMFRLRHYAGDVTYDITGFKVKNMDPFNRALSQMMFEAKNPLASLLFPDGNVNVWKVGSAARIHTTAASAFKRSMRDMIDLLNSKTPSYIRCIKPNNTKKPGVFDTELVTHQVRYLGLLENVRVRRAGFCYRQPFERFLARYRYLCPTTRDNIRISPAEGVAQLVSFLKLNPEEYRLGKSKIFIRNPKTVILFEEERDKLLPSIAMVIQRWWLIARVRKQFTDYFRLVQKAFAGVKDDPLLGRKTKWPENKVAKLKPAEENLRKIHKNWWAKMKMKELSPAQRDVLRKKVLGYAFFQGQKQWNPKGVWCGNYLSNNAKFLAGQTAMFQGRGDSQMYFGAPVNKVGTSGKPTRRILIVTNSHLYKLDTNFKFTDKRTLHLQQIESVTVAASDCQVCIVHSSEPGMDTIYEFETTSSDRLAEFCVILYLACRNIGKKIKINVANEAKYMNDKHGVRKLTFRPSPELDRNMPVKIVRNVSDGNGVKADVCFYATTGDLDQGW